MDGQTYAGQLSAGYTPTNGAFDTLSQDMLTDDQLEEFESDGTTRNEDYTGEIATIAWAYPSQSAHWGSGGLSLGQRFASRGGLVFLNAAGAVIDVRELASTSGPLGQPVSSTLSFAS